MPLYLVVTLNEFRQFLHIVLWIALPATLVAVVITTFLHYRKKKKEAREDPSRLFTHKTWSVKLPEEQAQTGAGEELPDWLVATGYGGGDSSTLMRKYQQEARLYRENYALLEQDFRELEERYMDLLSKAYRTGNEEHTALVTALRQELATYKERTERVERTPY